MSTKIKQADSALISAALISTVRNNTHSGTGSVLVDTGRMREEVKALRRQLEATNEEIQRQELKIALNSKTKSYERVPARLLPP